MTPSILFTHSRDQPGNPNARKEFPVRVDQKRILNVISIALLLISGFLSASSLWHWMRTGQLNWMVLALGGSGVFYAGYLIHSLRPWLKSVSLSDAGLHLHTRIGIKYHSWKDLKRVKSYTLNYPKGELQIRHLAFCERGRGSHQQNAS